MILDYKILFGVAAIVVGILQYLPYLWDMWKGTTTPHAFSWFIWGIPAGIVYLAQLLDGGGAGSWATGLTALLCSLIFVLALFRGEKNITRFDWFCLSLALVAIALWAATENALGAVILVTIADFLALGPTIRKSISKPYEETASTYVLGSVKWLFAIVALQSYSVTTLLYPVAMIVNNALFLAVIIPLRMRLKNSRVV